MPSVSNKPKVPWKCPKCGREFAARSAYHSCGNYTVEGYLAGKKSSSGIALYHSLADAARKFPGVIIAAAKTQITFRVRANFLMVGVSGCGIQGHIMLPRAAPKPYFKKIAAVSSRRHAHLFRITDANALNDFVTLLPEALSMVSDTTEEPKTSRAENKTRTSIGYQINAFYRAERRAQSRAR